MDVGLGVAVHVFGAREINLSRLRILSLMVSVEVVFSRLSASPLCFAGPVHQSISEVVALYGLWVITDSFRNSLQVGVSRRDSLVSIVIYFFEVPMTSKNTYNILFFSVVSAAYARSILHRHSRIIHFLPVIT
jgi:hypothetical protein